jgi:hypothetical protein
MLKLEDDKALTMRNIPRKKKSKVRNYGFAFVTRALSAPAPRFGGV